MLRRILMSSLAFIAAAHFVIAETAAVSQPGPTTKRSAFGQLEPAERAISLNPPETRVVKQIFINEGDSVEKGQPVLAVECDVEQAEYELSQARLALAKERVAAAESTLSNSVELLRRSAVAESRVDEERRQLELIRKELDVSQKQADLAGRRVERFTLRAPMDGRIYKLDVRAGDTLVRGDRESVVCGSDKLSARLFIEGGTEITVAPDAPLILYNAASGEAVAKGRVVSSADGQVVIELDSSDSPPLPLGMTLRAEL